MRQRFQYQPLDKSRMTTRLIDVDLSGRHQHSLVPQAGIESTKYISLSYRWGSANDSKMIGLDGRRFEVSTNLLAALDSVIRYWNHTYPERGVLLLWVDQICVDQSDRSDKDYQISIMGDIYRCSHRVLIWLPGTGGCARGFSDWAAWQSWHRQHVSASGVVSSQPLLTSMQENLSEDASQEPDNLYPGVSEQDRKRRSVFMAWQHIHDIVCSDWWGRVWVYQELMGPDQAIFLIDTLAAPWEALKDLLKLYHDYQKRHVDFCTRLLETLRIHRDSSTCRVPVCCAGCLTECLACAAETKDDAWKNGMDWDSGWPEMWRFLSRMCRCWEWLLRRCDAEPSSSAADGTLKAAQWNYVRQYSHTLINASPRWKLVNFMMNSKKEYVDASRTTPSGRRQSWLQLMSHSRNCQASNPADKVYAFLGLVEPGQGIGVSSLRPLSTLLTEVAKAIIKRERRLDILAIARESSAAPMGHPRELDGQRLPSWVPDWSVPDDANTPYREFLRDIRYPVLGHDYGMGPTRASLDTRASVSFHPDRYNNGIGILRARAIFTDRLTRQLRSPREKSYAAFAGTTGIEIQTVTSARLGDEVWVFLGADEIYTLRLDGETYRIIGHAMVMERSPMFQDIHTDTPRQREEAARNTTFVKDGGMIEKMRRGEVEAVNISIS
ncbi:heterokaryon incompatibility protein-domain-containing protein [Xylariaceae sp. FL0016]|nr:heterokaryon incompatibility protein-domain-containing protein [Xylariaceae sp. FL0016]